jgi:hypothetical protein
MLDSSARVKRRIRPIHVPSRSVGGAITPCFSSTSHKLWPGSTPCTLTFRLSQRTQRVQWSVTTRHCSCLPRGVAPLLLNLPTLLSTADPCRAPPSSGTHRLQRDISHIFFTSPRMVNATSSPLADAQFPVDASVVAGLVSRLTQGMSGWTVALTLFLGLVLYDQCTSMPLSVGEWIGSLILSGALLKIID